MQFDLETCAKIEETLAKSLARELDRVASRNPLLNLARRSSARARRVIVNADIRTNTPIVARYDVPSLAFGVDYRIDPSMTTLDSIIPRVDQYAVAAVRQYEKDLRSRLYRPHSGFLGLERLVPGTVGSNVIGGIDERLHPGWQSYAATNTYGVLDTLNVLDEVCATEDGEPDLTVLGTRAYGELVSSMDVQQRYWMISGTTTLLMLNGGGVYRDAQCGADSGYVLTTADFGFHAAVPRLMTEFTPDGRIRIRIRRDEQLVAHRRFRSGVVVPPRFPPD